MTRVSPRPLTARTEPAAVVPRVRRLRGTARAVVVPRRLERVRRRSHRADASVRQPVRADRAHGRLRRVRVRRHDAVLGDHGLREAVRGQVR